MAKSRIPCATPDCTNEILVVGQNRKLTDRKAAWMEDQGAICDECRHQQLIEADKKAAEQNAAVGLPELNGSEKQILWAEKIRADKLALIDQLADMPAIELPYHWEWRHLAEWVMDDLKNLPATDRKAAWKNAWNLPITISSRSARHWRTNTAPTASRNSTAI